MPDIVARWDRRRRAAFSLTPFFSGDGVALGAGTIVVRLGQGENLSQDALARAAFLMSAATRRSSDAGTITGLWKALACWRDGDRSLAHIRLAQSRPCQLESEDDAWRLFLAETLLDAGMTPDALSGELSQVEKAYDPNQPRNPAGRGRDSGRWTSGSVAPVDTIGPADDAPSVEAAQSEPKLALLMPPPVGLLQPLTPSAISWLARFASRLAGPIAFFGAMVIPDSNPGVANEGTLPGHPDVAYRIDHDDGSLRLTNKNDRDPDHVTVALLGHDGIYREVETGIAIARGLPDGGVVLDTEAATDGKPDEGRQPKAAIDEPKLCPAPQNDKKGGRKLFDQQYEQYVRSVVNPQRFPPLPPDLTFALPLNGKPVHYDDCQESTGKMVEAKGHYANAFEKDFLKVLIGKTWIDQAKKQVEAAKERSVEWYFHEAETAAFASSLFKNDEKLSRIKIHILPFPDDLPKHNPRIR